MVVQLILYFELEINEDLLDGQVLFEVKNEDNLHNDERSEEVDELEKCEASVNHSITCK